MQSNKSSRRGFFGKTLAFLGAAFACSNAPAAPADMLTSPNDLPQGFRLREIQDHLDVERWTVSYLYDSTEEYGCIDLSKCTYYEFDLVGTATTVGYGDTP